MGLIEDLRDRTAGVPGVAVDAARPVPVAVALLSLPPRSHALLAFFFANAGRGSYVEVPEAEAQAAIVDLDTAASREHWHRFTAQRPRPGLALAVQEPAPLPAGTTWVRKPATPAALLAVAPALREAAQAPGATVSPHAPTPLGTPDDRPIADAVPQRPAMAPPDPGAAGDDTAAALGTPPTPPAGAPAHRDPVDDTPPDAAETRDPAAAGPADPVRALLDAAMGVRPAGDTAAPPTDTGPAGEGRDMRAIAAVDAATRPEAPPGAAEPVAPAAPAVAVAVPTTEPVAARADAGWRARLRRWLQPAASRTSPVTGPTKSARAATATDAATDVAIATQVDTPRTGITPPDATAPGIPPAAHAVEPVAPDADPSEAAPVVVAAIPGAAVGPGAIEDTGAAERSDAPEAPTPTTEGEAEDVAVAVAGPEREPEPEPEAAPAAVAADPDLGPDASAVAPAPTDREAPSPTPVPADPAWFGDRPDVGPAELASDASRRYDAEAWLCGVLREAFLVSSRWQVPAQVDTAAGPLVVVAARNALHAACDDAALAALASAPLAARPKVNTLTEAACDAFVRRHADAATARRLDAALWCAALRSGRGRLPTAVDPRRVSFLRQWPNLTRLPALPHAMRLAALWAVRGASVVDAARTLGVPQREVIAFVNACWALNLLTDDGSHLWRARRRAAHPRGLLGRLLGWLRT